MEKIETVYGKIEKVDLLGSGDKDGKVWKRYSVLFKENPDKFITFDEGYAEKVGVEGEFPFVVEGYVDKIGAQRTQKKLIAPKRTPVAKPSERQILDEGALIKKMSEQIQTIYDYVISRK